MTANKKWVRPHAASVEESERMALTTRGTLQAASPSTAEATTNRATVLDELRQRCVEVAPSSEQVVAPAPGYGVSLGKTVAARQPRPSCAAASPALQTMAPADVFTAVFSCAVPACPKPHNAATVSKHDSSGPYRSGKVASPWSHHVCTVINCEG